MECNPLGIYSPLRVLINNKLVRQGLSFEIDFENVDENLQILALTRVAAGF
jgi:hypothetical protein